MTKKKNADKPSLPVVSVDDQPQKKQKLTKLERIARHEMRQSIRVAAYGSDFGNVGGSNIKQGDSSFYSPQLSTDFLELPQSEREKRELYRFWYNSHPIVGAAIDFHCFVPGVPVTLKNGSTELIEKLNVGDEVVNGFGEYTTIKRTIKHDVDGQIKSLKIRGVQDLINVTDDHPFLVYRAETINCTYPKSGTGACKFGTKFICRHNKCSGKYVGKPEYVLAKDLKVGDYICSVPIKSSNSFFTRAQLRLLGYYAAEGSLSRTKYGVLDRSVFTLNADEYKTIANEIESLFQLEYSHKAVSFLRKDSNSCEVRCYKKDFAEFCFEHVGSGSSTKVLSQPIIDSPREDILEFLGAYWNGDGCLTKNGYVATTVSRKLAYQIHTLALKVGFSPTLRKINPRTSGSGFRSDNPTYQILIPYRFFPEFSKYANFINSGYSASTTREYSTQVGPYSLKKIEKIDTVNYSGPVYNLEVNGDGDAKSYIVHGLVTHNCDVPMSKLRLSLPKGKDHRRNKQILHFYQQMCSRVQLFQTLYDATHEYWLNGGCYLFCEDHDLSDEIPEDLLSVEEDEEIGEVDYAGRVTKKSQKKRTLIPETVRSQNIRKYVQENYQGWQRIQILPPEQIKLETFQYTNKVRMELIPSEKDRLLVLKAVDQNDPESIKIAEDIPEQIRENLLSGQPIPLNTSPYDDFLCSSFCYYLAHKKAAYDERGISLLERCHLPGTEVTILRNGQTLQVPIQDLNSKTDEVLGGSGKWRKFEHGTRFVSEDIVELSVDKVLYPVRLTSDHKMKVVRGDKQIDVLAGEILPGDYVRMAQVELSESLKSVNLVDFVRKIGDFEYVGRRSGEVSSTSIMVIEEGEKTFNVQYIKTETDPRIISYNNKIDAALQWLESLTEPVTLSGPDFCKKFGFYPSDKTKVRRHLAELGASTEVSRVGKLYLTTFYPLRNCGALNRSRNVFKSFHKTISLDANTGYIIGYWLGDGWIRKNDTTLDYGQLGICYSSKSPNSCASAKFIKSNLDSMGVKWSEISSMNGMKQILCYNDIFTRWVGTNFGHTKDDKHIPDWVFNTSREFLFGILRGLVDSDGCVTSKKTGVTTVQIAMSTKALMDQVILIMQSLGIPPSVHLHKSRDTNLPNDSVKHNCRPLWQAAFSDSETVATFMQSGFLAKHKNVSIPSNQGWGCKHRFFNGFLHYRVKSLNKVQYDGPVYSLNVHEDHSFYANRIWHANCIRTLNFQDKLRQAQTSIASRAMTPKRIVWADKMSEIDTDSLRDQVDQAIVDPDFTIITNFEVHWDEIGSRDRLLDLSTEYEITNKMLYIGLRITESMLTGESSYSGEKIHLDVMNTMYLLFRERISEFVEEWLFKPVAEKKGFWEEDEFGNRQLLYPKLQFTRLALRDNSELQDYMFNLYQKGSLPISFILDLLNIDSDDALEQLKRDMFTPNDSTFNEFLKGVLTKAGDEALDMTDAMDKIIMNAGLKRTDKKSDRFGKSEGE